MSNDNIKPIVIIYLPENFSINSNELSAPTELMRILNGNFGESDPKIKYNDYWKDYLWFCFYDHEVNSPQFKVFYPKDFTEIQYEELKKLIENSLQKIQP